MYEELQTDIYKNQETYEEIKQELINTLSQNGFSISETRYLFFDILERFDRAMPVTTELTEPYKINMDN